MTRGLTYPFLKIAEAVTVNRRYGLTHVASHTSPWRITTMSDDTTRTILAREPFRRQVRQPGNEMDHALRTISVQEAGRLLGLSKNSAYQAAKRGELPTLAFGRRLVVPVAALEAMLRAAGRERQEG